MNKLQEIKEKHHFMVWETVSKDNAKGLLQSLKGRLLNEHSLSDEDKVSFTAYALERSGILVLTADKSTT
ncbi:hypothetical protein [Paenibacillus puerhi]|uniref:hypothetical protein n=1 Tax=Paenibacillus puerhi TaxID=2692622 RepID=UPI001357B967|nr:hypothetical protein [Paenibacillus puerhi]